MSMFAPIAESFPNWTISGPTKDENCVEAWRVVCRPWELSFRRFANDSYMAHILYQGRKDDSIDAHKGQRPADHYRHIWMRQGMDLDELIAGARNEVALAASIPAPPKPEPSDDALTAQAEKVAEAIRAKPKLLNRVLYALRRPMTASPWTYCEPGEASEVAMWIRMAPHQHVAAIFPDSPKGPHNMIDWWAIGDHEQSRTNGTARTVEDAKANADRVLRELGWTLA